MKKIRERHNKLVNSEGDGLYNTLKKNSKAKILKKCLAVTK